MYFIKKKILKNYKTKNMSFENDVIQKNYKKTNRRCFNK